MTTAATEQGLEKADKKALEKTPEEIRTAEEFRGTLKLWEERHYNILSPFMAIAGLPDLYVISATFVHISPDKADGLVYDGLPFLKKDEVAIAKTGLRKLADALGVSLRSFRTDPRTIPYYWEIKAVASYRGIDGGTITREATKEWDLRDGSPQMKGWSPNQIEEGRKHGLRNCEARAINAVIRECGCGIKQKYTKADLLKPFAVIRVGFNTKDPDIRKAIAQQAFAGTATLYPSVAPRGDSIEAEVEVVPEVHEPRAVGSGATEAAKPTEPPAEPQPPTADAVHIVKVNEITGTNKESGRKWTKWAIVDHKGVEHSTFSRSIRDDAERLQQAETWVEFEEEESEDGRFSNITQIQPVPLTTTATPDDSAL